MGVWNCLKLFNPLPCSFGCSLLGPGSFYGYQKRLKAIPDDTEPPSKEKITELIEEWLSLEKVSADQRERLAITVERLDQSSDRIRESRRTMMEISWCISSSRYEPAPTNSPSLA
ncbi:hypothetical protein Bca52824_026499 [Brassica carinata]|uniref:Uncharacterized protein n=1 Tax=Brassica carinata TaxID=52824 RepID=A0A8X7V9Y0_BRACI|nr:hypothetical protein Bca52824_026499 [Brassica carinata]